MTLLIFPPEIQNSKSFFHRQSLNGTDDSSVSTGDAENIRTIISGQSRHPSSPASCLAGLGGCLGKSTNTGVYNDASNIWWFVAQRFLSVKKDVLEVNKWVLVELFPALFFFFFILCFLLNKLSDSTTYCQVFPQPRDMMCHEPCPSISFKYINTTFIWRSLGHSLLEVA